jgi:WD40 repeat protein
MACGKNVNHLTRSIARPKLDIKEVNLVKYLTADDQGDEMLRKLRFFVIRTVATTITLILSLGAVRAVLPARPVPVKDDPVASEDNLPAGAIARLGDSRMRVVGIPQSLAFSPDGKLLAVGARDCRFVFVFAVRTGRLVGRLSVPDSPTRLIAFTADGEELHCVNGDRWLRWRAADFSPLPPRVLDRDDHQTMYNPFLHAHGQRYGYRYNAKSNTGHADNTVSILDLAGNQRLFDIPFQAKVRVSIAREADVAAMCTADEFYSDGHLEVWDIARREKLHQFDELTQYPYWVEISTDGKRLYTAALTAGPVRAWDLQRGAYLGELISPGAVYALKLTPGGKALLIGGARGKTVLLDIAAKRIEQTVELGRGYYGAVAFSPDGKLAAVGGFGNRVQLWDLAAGSLRFERTGMPHKICRLTAVRVEKNVVVSSGEARGAPNTVGVWDTPGRKLLYQLALPMSGPVRISPDGRWLAVATEDGLTRYWPIDDPDKVIVLPPSNFLPFVAGSSRDGRVLAIAGPAGLIEIREFLSLPGVRPHPLLELRGHIGPIRSLVFAENGSTLASCGEDETLRVWDASVGNLRRQLDLDDSASAIAVSHRGGRVAASIDHNVSVWSVATGDLAARWEAPAEIVSLAFSPDDKTLASIESGGRVALWDAGSGQCLANQKLPMVRLTAFDFSPDGRLLAVAGVDPSVHLLDAKDLTPAHKLDGEGNVESLRFDLGGARLLVNTRNGTLHAWDLEKKECFRKYTGLKAKTMAFTTLKDRCAVLTARRCRWTVDLKQDALPGDRLLYCHRGMGDCAFSPDSKLLATSTPAAMRIWDIASGDNLANLVTERDCGRAAAFSPGGDAVAGGGEGITIWDVETGKVKLAIPPEQASKIRRLAYSPDGSVLASLGFRGMKLWEAATGRLIAAVSAGVFYRQRLSFTADGRMVVAIELEPGERYSGRVTGWDVFTGRPVWRLGDPPFQTFSCAISLDGRTLLTGDRLGRTTIWDWPSLLEEEFAPTGENLPATGTMWRDLGSRNPRRAYRAVFALAARPVEALGLVKNVEPAAATDSRDQLKVLRILHLLERIGTDAARHQLSRFAQESVSPFVKRQAGAAAQRIMISRR